MAVFTITGATGSVGKAIVRTLQHHSHEIRVLSTRKSLEMTGATSYYWNPATNEIDSDALEGADYLIHLAGATVSKRWTASYKKADCGQPCSGNTTFDWCGPQNEKAA